MRFLLVLKTELAVFTELQRGGTNEIQYVCVLVRALGYPRNVRGTRPAELCFYDKVTLSLHCVGMAANI